MKNHVATLLGSSALFIGALVGPVAAQTMPATQTQTTQTTQTTDTTGPHNAYCGNYVAGTWTPNGNCVVETTTTTTSTTPATTAVDPNAPARVPQRLTGTITSVKGHLVTLQQSTNTLVVDDSRALKREDTGKVAVGRAITAHGYWEAGTFYAGRFETAPEK